MLENLLELFSFCKDNGMLNDEQKYLEEMWKELQEVVDSLTPDTDY